MKKKIITLAMCLIGSMSVMAQELVVTLTHGEENKTYSGIEAFSAAMKDAVDGDLVSLSSGIFHGATITKSLVIRGNGAEGDQATIFNTEVEINKPAIENDPGLNIQGINFSANLRFNPYTVSENIVISKCDMARFYCHYVYSGFDKYARTKNLSVIQCRIKEDALFRVESEVNFINSIITKMTYTNYNANHNICFENCIVMFTDNNQVFTNDSKLNFSARNSIIITNGKENDAFVTAPVLNHCIVTGVLENMPNVFSKCTARDCQYMPITSVFKTVTDNTKYVDDAYDLTESAAAIVGTNGTQLGIHGGYLPYDNKVSYPQFSTFQVDEKAENGVLKVNVKVTNE